ncbi:hypothetical protein [Maribacter stanieri]|uniref:hypothetical protein n=1 Tax=Maribacter stanieri TaxID=440514 RepID=UPI0024952432|nr:hypothetical protein [Maribacter stanieri]
MNNSEIIIAIIIHIVFPLAGFVAFVLLTKKMKNQKVEKRPTIDLFFIFVNYGGLLFVILTELFWQWSGMASLGLFYLVLAAPIIMGIIAYRNFKNKGLSKYHDTIYKLGLSYCILIPILVFGIRSFL